MPISETFLTPPSRQRVYRARSVSRTLKELNDQQIVLLNAAGITVRLFTTDYGFCAQKVLGSATVDQIHCKFKKNIKAYLETEVEKSLRLNA